MTQQTQPQLVLTGPQPNPTAATMIPTAQGLLLNQVITYDSSFMLDFVSIILHVHYYYYIKHIDVTLYFIRYTLYTITACNVHSYISAKESLCASYICHVWYVGVAVDWTCYCTAATRWRSTHTKDASKRPATNTHCTGDGLIRSSIASHHVFTSMIIAYTKFP